LTVATSGRAAVDEAAFVFDAGGGGLLAQPTNAKQTIGIMSFMRDLLGFG
jgi:hypothetical protein